MRYGAIYNPASGRGRGGRNWPGVESQLRGVLGESLVMIEPTRGPRTASEQAAAMAALGLDVVIASGGDGTVNTVLQGLVGTQTALAILPAGTGNDFARTIGVQELGKALGAIGSGVTRPCDLGRWRSDNAEGYFLNVAGCGFDAAVARRINEGVRFLRGTPAYLVALLLELGRYKPIRYEIVADGERLDCDAMLCAIANARSYGGGMHIAPEAEIGDGLLDLVIVNRMSKFEFISQFPKVFKGSHICHPKVVHKRFRELRIVPACPAPILFDGELAHSASLEVTVVPDAIQVVVPANVV